MNSDIDIVVIGCGVAGATAAETAASLGSRVLALEEHDQVGIPSHCSGHVSINSMKRLGVEPPQDIIKNQIRGATFHSPTGQVLRLERGAPITWVLDRKALDEHLTAGARKAGVEIHLNSRALALERSGRGELQVRISSIGQPHELNCGLVIDCEGAVPKLTPQKLPGERRKSMWVNSAQVHVDHVEDLDEDMVEVYLGSSYAPGFFAWIIPWHDGSAKVGLAAREGNARHFLERFMTRHPEVSPRLKSTSRRDVTFHPIPLGGPISKTFYPGMLIAGDSAQQVKPTTGGGIVFSLICGKAAGEVAHEASEARDTSERFLSRYERQWKSEIGRDLNAMRRIRRMLFRLPDRQLERIFSVARALDAATVLSKADDIDMQSRTLIRLGLDPRLTFSLLFSSVLSLPFIATSGQTGVHHQRRP